ncbi:MAG: DUF6785 family protein [Candidatus Bathyarchaeia archaeon]
MNAKEKETEVVVRIRPTAYVAGIIFILAMIFIKGFEKKFFPVYVPFGNIGPNWWPFNIGYIQDTFFFLIVFMIIVSLLPKGTFNRGEIAVIASMIFATAPLVGLWGFAWTGPASWAASAEPWGQYVREAIERFGPSFFVLYAPDPRDLTSPIYADMIYGHANFFAHLPAWIGPIMFTYIWTLSLMFMMMFLAIIFRRQFIDIEAMQYPYGLALTEIARSTSERRLFSNIWLWIGLGVGILMNALLWLDYLVPGVINMPNFGSRSYLVISLQYYFPGNRALDISFDPFLIGIAALAPAPVMLSYFIWTTILWVILPTIFEMVGFYSPGWAADSESLWLAMFRQYGPQPTWWKEAAGGGVWTLAWGVTLGYLFIPFIINRRVFIESLKAIRKPVPEIEKNEAIPYRYAWIGFIASWLIFAVLYIPASAGILGGARFIGVILFTVSWYILKYSLQMRLGGETGNIFQVDSHHDFHQSEIGVRFGWIGESTPAIGGKGLVPAWYIPHGTPEKTIALWAIRTPRFGTGYTSGGEATGGIGRTLLDIFKMGQLMNVPLRQLFVGVSLAVVIGMISHIIVTGWFNYTFGVKAISGSPWGSCTMHSVGGSELCCFQTTPPSAWAFVAAGFIGMAAYYFIIMRFPGLPIPHPAGIAMQTVVPPWFWIPSLVGYLIRRFSIQVGGPIVYEKKIVPFAVGLIASYPFVVNILWLYSAYIGYLTW